MPSLNISYEDIQIPAASVPLEVCLSKESRTLLDSEWAKGGRNTNAKLAQISSALPRIFEAIRQRFDGDPGSCWTIMPVAVLPVKEVDAI